MPEKTPVVMVIEDEDLLLQAITKKLKTNGIETVSTTSGEQALDYLKELDKVPDVIWLDYHLKGMDGLELLTHIKSNEKTKNIPVVVVSNSASDEKIQNMLTLGAEKYLLKAEHRLDEIIQTIREFAETGK